MTAWLIAATWKGTLLVAFALAVHRVARNRVPSKWLCALLLVAIVRLLTPVAPAASFSVFNLVPGSTPRTTLIVSGGAAPASGAVMLRAAESGRPSTGTTEFPYLLTLWALGAAFVCARTARRMFLFHRQLADRTDVDRDDVRVLLDECRARLGIRRHVRVATTGAVVTPSLHGWLRPALLLPHGFLDSFTLEQLRYVVLHELAHLRRSDVLINWIATAAQAVHWFNPLVHLAVARLAEERELACDALALEALDAAERPAYGGTVLEIVDRLRTARLVPALVGMTATPQQLKRRIVMIASFRRQSRHSILFAALVVAVGLVTLTDATAGEVHLQMKQREPLSPGAEAAMKRLEQTVNLQFDAATVDQILNAIANATGASINVPGDVITEETRQAKITLKGTNIPAHLVLFETLHSLDLGAKFTDAGVEVVKADTIGLERAPVRLRFAGPPPAAGGDAKNERIMILRDGTQLKVEPGDGHARAQHFSVIEEDRGSMTGSGNRRTLKFRGTDEASEGTLEIEVKK